MVSHVPNLHVEYAERRHKYGLQFMFSLLLALALCSCEKVAGVRGVFSVGVSCVRVTC